MDAYEGLVVLFYVVLAAIVLTLVMREVACWYWKINRRVRLQEDILAELQSIRKHYQIPLKGIGESALDTLDLTGKRAPD